jgi:type IV secretory pathway TrbD component
MSAGAIAAAIYGGVSIAAGLVFLAVTIAFGDYDWVARTGGAVWIFALCMIILMPTVTPLIRERMNRKA